MKRNTSLIVALSAVIFTITVTIGTSLAWFGSMARMNTEDNPFEGSVQDKYYASGSGTSQDPFVITRPRHLYNLAWLQLLGFYNKNTGDDNHQFYFKLGNNIDMGDYCAIPPIGTELNPFVGHFDGAGYMVSNLKVSNDFSDYTFHPSVINNWTSTYKQPHILGFFGVIGQYPGGNQNSTYTSSINAFVNTGITGANIKTVVLDSLVGLAAGYAVDSDLTDAQTTLKNVVVDNSTISLPETGTTAKYIYDNEGHAWTNNLSDFTLVGYTNDVRGVVKASETMYGVNVDSNITYSASESGTNTGWGGSLNMINMYDRLVDVRENYSTNSTSYGWKKNHVIAPGATPNSANDTVTTASTSMETSNSTSLRTFNHGTSGYQKAGNFVTTRRAANDTVKNYNYLQGGTFNVYNYQKLYHHTGYRITVDGTNYLTSTNIANNGSVTSSSESNAIVWTIPTTGTSGKIYTTYNYTNYYLAVSGSTVILRTGETNGTTWEIDRDASGHVRYVYNGNYLNYDNGWVMTALPAEPQEPQEPQAPTEPEPVEPIEPIAPNEADYTGADDEFQISSNGTRYLKYTGSGNATFTTGYSDNPWKFTDPDGTSTEIFTTVNNRTYYVYITRTNQSYVAGLTETESDGTTWTRTNANKFYAQPTTRYFYLSVNNNNLYVTRGNTTYSQNSGTAFTITSMAEIAHQQYLSDYSTWETNHATWETNHATWVTNHGIWQTNYDNWVRDHAAWVTDHAAWVTNHANWVTTMNNLHPIILSYAEVDGPDIDNTYDRTEYGMEYTSTNTTFFPINIVKDDEVTHTATTNSISDYYPKDTNTGYITVGSNFTSSTTQMTKDNSTMRVSRYDAASGDSNKNIKNSFKTGDTSLTNVKTVNASGTTVNVDNALAATYEKYADSKSAFEGILTSAAALDNGTRYLYGLHFMDATISMDHVLTADWVSINGAEKTNYELPVNSIDFNLKESGYINFFAGTYFTDTVNSFFSLHKVVRSGNTISNIFEIEEIYKDTATTAKNHAYVYKLKDKQGNITYSCPYTFDAQGNKTTLVAGKDPEANNLTYGELPAGYVSASSCVFKTSQIKTNTLTQYYAYYFEIPVNAGEYCLGSVPGGTGGYLLYLDIGANAAKTNRTILYEKFVVTESTYSFPAGVSLISLPSPSSPDLTPTTTVIDITQLVDASDSACMVIKATALGDYGIDRNILTNGNDDVALSRENASLAPPIYAYEEIDLVHEVESDTPIQPTAISASSYDVKRMLYYDFVINSDSLYVTTITDKNNGDDTYTRSITQSLYSGNVVTNTPTATYVYDGTTDQRSSMKIYNSGNNGVKYTPEQLIVQTAGGLVLDASKLSNTQVLTFKLLLNGSDEFDPCPTLVAVPDSTNLAGTFYLFDNFKFDISAPAGGDITIKVTYWDGSTEIYFGTYVVNSGTQVIVIQ